MARRYRLAAELVRHVPWLSRVSVPRVAWVVRHLADAGWAVEEVLGWLSIRDAATQVRRPSGFLAARVSGAEAVVTTPEQRQRLAEAWRDSRRAAAARHVEWSGTWAPPASAQVRALVDQALDGASEQPEVEAMFEYHVGDPDLLLEDLTREEVIQLRGLAADHPDLVLTAVDTHGEAYARRLYTHAVVDRLLRQRRIPRATRTAETLEGAR